MKRKNRTAFNSVEADYTAKDIEVLEGLEPIRRRPGMYIGGTDERALHHLAAEILDNSMDEAVAGHATRIEIELNESLSLTISDNGRGIPIDPHPKHKGKSALEVILTTLHSGGKFNGKAYITSGGLHGVGLSVVNALSKSFYVEVARGRKLYQQSYSRGIPKGNLEHIGSTNNRRGTVIQFSPDLSIFDKNVTFSPLKLFNMTRSKAYLFRGVQIRWKCNKKLLKAHDNIPEKTEFYFPNGLSDYLKLLLNGSEAIIPGIFSGESNFADTTGRVEWAVSWPTVETGFFHSYCNTVPTPLGGTHELGFRNALLKSIRGYGELIGNKQAAQLNAEDLLGGAFSMLSVFISNPQFQGQTKEKLSNSDTQKIVEAAVRDHFDHWLSAAPDKANMLLSNAIERAETRLRKRQNKHTKRQTATRRLRLPGKLTDCALASSEGTELFIVEGDSAGGSAKQARNRTTQAILPIRGKILNVISATADKIVQNQEIADVVEALGCGMGDHYNGQNLRYEKIIIMTDADVDGAHIASLLMTLFYKEMPELVSNGHLYLALPPLYRITARNQSAYAMDENHKEQLINGIFKGAKVEVNRFKGLGEMPPNQLKETAMDPKKRSLLRLTLPNSLKNMSSKSKNNPNDIINQLMGKNPELRFSYIQQNAPYVNGIDV